MVSADELRELLAATHEWLMVRETGRAFPLENHLIEISPNGDKMQFSFLDDGGWRTLRLNKCELEGSELILGTSSAFGEKHEALRLIPRTPAAELTAEIELARLEKANEIALLIAAHY